MSSAPVATVPGRAVPFAASDPRWDPYVEAHPDALVYHLSAWSGVLAAAYRWTPAHLAWEHEGALAGVMPLMYKRARVSGTRLNSLPAIRLGGPVADSPEIGAALIQTACRLADERGCPLALESPREGLGRAVPSLSHTHRIPTWIADLPQDRDELDERLRRRSKNVWRSVKRAKRL